MDSFWWFSFFLWMDHLYNLFACHTWAFVEHWIFIYNNAIILEIKLFPFSRRKIKKIFCSCLFIYLGVVGVLCGKDPAGVNLARLSGLLWTCVFFWGIHIDFLIFPIYVSIFKCLNLLFHLASKRENRRGDIKRSFHCFKFNEVILP